jgi:HAD superfamily hydrolase (TIGR01509 family)
MDRRAIVFDCDGVLIDSEGLAWRAWREVLATYGYTPSDGEIQYLLGRSADEIQAYFSSKVMISDEAEMKAALDTSMMRLFEENLMRFEDAVSLAFACKARGLPMAVASSSDHQRLVQSLRLVGLLELFDVIVGGDDVEHGKPSPDVFLEAARQLGVDAGNCLAVEDSVVGVESAVAAGMFVVAVARASARRDELGSAQLVVDALVPELLDHEFMTSALPISPNPSHA